MPTSKAGKSDDLELWGTIRGWSEQLGIPEDVLRERFKGLPTKPCLAKDPTDPERQVVTDAYPQPEVLEAVKDLLAQTDPSGERTKKLAGLARGGRKRKNR